MGRYAQHTSVPVDRTRIGIERVLERYGADSFMSTWDRRTGQEAIAFIYRGIQIQISLRRPKDDPKGQKNRQRWRALLLVIKAKLEAVDSEISTFEKEFLAWVVDANGRTLGDALVPHLKKLSKAGQLTRLLPNLTEEIERE